MHLDNRRLPAIATDARAAIPIYDRSTLQPGIVHLGLGAFHRAHQAAYIEAVLATGDLRWGIIGVSLRQPETRNALAPQDQLYTLSICDGEGERLQVIGALMATLVAPENPAAVVAAMTDPRCHIVSLTITEKGYCHDPASATLRLDHPDIAHDLAHIEAPRSALGFIVSALKYRRATGTPAFTVLSCDNLPANGHTTRKLVLAFAEQIDAGLAAWIATGVRFPNSMVDRIVPKTTAQDRLRIAARLGTTDAWPVISESFSQWIIEDDFGAPRPHWEDAGAIMVSDAEPYEHAKLRMLNGSHSTLAYLGVLLGYDTVDQAVADDTLTDFIIHMMADEIEPTLSRPGLPAYRAELLQRFRNPALKHRLHQIAMDGSQKLPQRLLGTIRSRLADGRSCDRLCFALAGWLRYLTAHDESGRPYAITDPLAADLQQAASIPGDAGQRVRALLRISAVFGIDLPANPLFVATLTRYLGYLESNGVAVALQAWQESNHAA